MVEDLDLRLIEALVEFIRKSRGRKVTIRANTLVKISGLENKQSHILRAARMLKILSTLKLLKVEFKDKIKSRILRYIVDDNMELWKLAKKSPEKTIHKILSILKTFSRKDVTTHSETNTEGIRAIEHSPTTLRTSSGYSNSN